MRMSETREHILEVAGRLFLQSNYDGVSIQEITRAAEMTKGALTTTSPARSSCSSKLPTTLWERTHTDFSALPGDSLRAFYTTLVRPGAPRTRLLKRPNCSNADGINV